MRRYVNQHHIGPDIEELRLWPRTWAPTRRVGSSSALSELSWLRRGRLERVRCRRDEGYVLADIVYDLVATIRRSISVDW
jgi:hypothetical protein